MPIPRLIARAHRAGRKALAHVQPLSGRGTGAARRAARRRDVRRPGVLLQFGRRSLRGGDQDRAALPIMSRPSRALAHHRLRRRLPRPHARDHRSRRQPEISARASGLRSKASTMCRSPILPPSRQAIGPETAAIMIEPMQGEGGINVAPRRVPAGLARTVRPPRPAAHPR